MTQVTLPNAARDRLLDRFGPVAAAWIDDFGPLVGELCQKWALEPLAVHAGGTGAVVECVSTTGGTRYALKLSPDSTVTQQEAAALAYWTDAPTVVDLVDTDATRGAILLEWVPEPAESTADASGIADVAGLIGDLYLLRGALPAEVPPPASAWNSCSSCGIDAGVCSGNPRSMRQFGAGVARLRWVWQMKGIRFFTAIFIPATCCGRVTAAKLSRSTLARASAIRQWTSPTSP
jgi:hypothetical protein